MCAADLERVLEIAASLQEAPRWPVSAYAAAMNPENRPRRIALVLEATAAIESVEVPAAHTILGFAVASLVAPEAELETIAVGPQSQRRGLGALLLRAVAAELEREHVTELILEVRASNRLALGFYRAQGFEESGRRARYYADPQEDAVLMRLKLA
jgi:ribosomal-protein-alanine N-acetyltransferase